MFQMQEMYLNVAGGTINVPNAKRFINVWGGFQVEKKRC